MVTIDESIELIRVKHISMHRVYGKILVLLAEGYISKQIGALTNYSPRTIEDFIQRLKDAHGAKTQAHLITICFQKKILKINE